MRSSRCRRARTLEEAVRDPDHWNQLASPRSDRLLTRRATSSACSRTSTTRWRALPAPGASRDAALPELRRELLAALDVAELPVVEKWFDRT